MIFGEKGLRIKREKSMVGGFVKYLPSACMDCTIPRFTASCSQYAASVSSSGSVTLSMNLLSIPKETSIDNLTQMDIFKMMNRINSYKRKKLNNRSPYETFSFLHGEEVLVKLGCRPVEAKDICLKPKLLKK